jgi:hypothetical protein
MNEGAAKYIRRMTKHLSPKDRAAARATLERAWKAGSHRQRGDIRRMLAR